MKRHKAKRKKEKFIYLFTQTCKSVLCVHYKGPFHMYQTMRNGLHCQRAFVGEACFLLVYSTHCCHLLRHRLSLILTIATHDYVITFYVS